MPGTLQVCATRSISPFPPRLLTRTTAQTWAFSSPASRVGDGEEACPINEELDQKPKSCGSCNLASLPSSPGVGSQKCIFSSISLCLIKRPFYGSSIREKYSTASSFLCACACACTCVCVHVHVCICVCACVRVPTHTQTPACVLAAVHPVLTPMDAGLTTVASRNSEASGDVWFIFKLKYHRIY